MKYGAVSTGHQLTSKSAIQILESGGNAVDAAISAYATACVSEPCMASMAAGAFALIYFEGQMHSLDAFCQTPGQKRDQSDLQPIPVDFGTTQEVYYGGPGSVAIPGALKGLFELHDRFGTMPFKDLFENAIRRANEGVALSAFQRLDLGLLQSIYALEPRGREIFFKDGELKDIGDSTKMEFYADFLDVLAREGQDLFYKGEISRQLAEMSKSRGGHLRREDLEAYEVRWNSPELLERGNERIFMPPGPSMGHALIKHFYNALELSRFKGQSFTKEHIDFLLPGLSANKHLMSERELLFRLAGVDSDDGGKLSGTSHLNILDKKGNAIAMTFSIGEGSGIFVEGTDIHLNNMLGEPALLPNGLNSWTPDRRLASMMTPTMIMKENELTYIMGTGGAERIPTILAQVIHYMTDLGLSLSDAIEAPRMYYSSSDLQVEPGFDTGNLAMFMPLKQWTERSLYFGGVHAIESQGDQAIACGDERREGHGVVV